MRNLSSLDQKLGLLMMDSVVQIIFKQQMLLQVHQKDICSRCLNIMFSGTSSSTTATGNLSPRICGINSGYHMYVDAGTGLASDASLNAVIANSATWKIKAENIIIYLDMIKVYLLGQSGAL